jgi:hypothetical protein
MRTLMLEAGYYGPEPRAGRRDAPCGLSMKPRIGRRKKNGALGAVLSFALDDSAFTD